MPWHSPCYPGCLCHPSPGASPRRRVPHQTEPQCTSCTPPERQLVKRSSAKSSGKVEYNWWKTSECAECQKVQRKILLCNFAQVRNHRDSSVPLQLWWVLQALQAPRHSKPPKKHLVHAPKGCQPSVQVSSQRNLTTRQHTAAPTTERSPERSRPS